MADSKSLVTRGLAAGVVAYGLNALLKEARLGPKPWCCALHGAKGLQAPDGTMWYFAIGSMINLTSLKLRGIEPLESYPAELLGHRVVFANSGMGDVRALTPGAEPVSHGVLHRLSSEKMAALDKIELTYSRLPCQARLYDGTIVCAWVYKMVAKGNIGKIELPQERYLDIIARGLESAGAKQSYIDWIRQHPCRPRTPPAERLSFKALLGPIPDRLMTPQQLAAAKQLDGGGIHFALSGVVLHMHARHPSVKVYSGLFAWKDVTLMLATYLYEPMFPVVTSLAEMSADHVAYLEDMFLRMEDANIKFLTPVARLTQAQVAK